MTKFIFVCVRSEKRQPHRRFTNYFVRLLLYARKRNAPQMWWDTEQVAHHFGVSRKSIPEFIRNGLAPPVKFSNKIHRFSVESVYEFDRKLLTGEIKITGLPPRGGKDRKGQRQGVMS